MDAVLKSFHDKGYMLNNTYGMSKDQYYDEMRKSKFIMCPSGLGWDTYRMWEAFYLGIIPVVEKYNRRDGWHKTMDGLPIVWVNTFEEGLNPAFLESEYKRIVAAKEQYKFEKLTVQYWKAFVESFLPDTNETSHLLTPHNSRIPNEDIKDMKQVNSSNKSEVNHAAANTGGIRLISSSMRHMDINPKSTKVLIIRNERAKITKGHQVTLA
uniref:RXYLT1 C-terminal domain-containing protein n=1 Tax=Eucampia antarctica TaxID=49252 RepID=A0A7S2WDL7_9STRA